MTNKIKYKTIFLFFVIFPIFVDQINGYLIHELSVSFSFAQLYKGPILLFSILFVFLYGRFSEKIIILIIIITVFLPLINVNFFKPYLYSSISKDISFSLKLLAFPIYFVFYSILLRKFNFLHLKTFKFVIFSLFSILFFALVLSLFGFGRSQYGYSSTGLSYGFKGFFIAGNELSGFFILIYSLTFSYIYIYKSFQYWLLFIFLGFIISILLVTKTSLISFLLISVFLPFFIYWFRFYFPGFDLKLLLKKHIFIIFCSSLLIFSSIIYFFYERLQINYVRFAENLTKAGDLKTFILSARNERYENVLEFFINYDNVFSYLFGTGWTHFQFYILSDGSEYSAEMDLLDLLVSNGLIGVFVLYGFWFFIMFSVFNNLKRGSVLLPSLLFALLLLFTNSFISGHIIYSALLGHYLAFFSAFLIGYKNFEK